MDTFDTIIVGAGSAASLLAARLAEDGRRTLCVLEAGPPDTNRWLRTRSVDADNQTRPRGTRAGPK